MYTLKSGMKEGIRFLETTPNMMCNLYYGYLWGNYILSWWYQIYQSAIVFCIRQYLQLYSL